MDAVDYEVGKILLGVVRENAGDNDIVAVLSCFCAKMIGATSSEGSLVLSVFCQQDF